MDAPPIQYARTEDGVNIAWWEFGNGPPLVYLPAWTTHAERVWDIALARELFLGLASQHRLVYFDPRGFGMSDQDPADCSLDGFVADIAAIFKAANLSSAFIFAETFCGHPAIRYAAASPERVDGLALFGTVLSYPAWKQITSMGGLFDLFDAAQSDTQFEAARMVGASFVDRLTLDDFRALISGWGTRAYLERALASGSEWDATHDAALVRAPTIVLGRQDDLMFPVETLRPLAAAIPGATLRVMPGKGAWAFDGEIAPVLEAVAQRFELSTRADPTPTPQGFRTLLFTDLESSTALTQSLGDAKAQEVLDGHDAAVRTALEANGGEEVKHTGDGIFAAFTSAVSAVEAALQLQRELAGAEVRVRVGLNAGEPIAKDDDYFGSAVQLAARVCDRAEPGQVLVSNVVKELCTGKLFQFEDQGEVTLKGFPEPVRLFVVGEGE